MIGRQVSRKKPEQSTNPSKPPNNAFTHLLPEISFTWDKNFHYNERDFLMSTYNIPGILHVLLFYEVKMISTLYKVYLYFV